MLSFAPFWSIAVLCLPAYLADSFERVQKRAVNIILPGRSYREALSELHCPRLDERRDALCERTKDNWMVTGYLIFYLRLEKT